MRLDRKRIRTWIVRPILALALVPAGFLAWSHATSNFGTVAPGAVYRSGQMDASRLAKTLRGRGIKTVLNLRGHHPEAAWYRAERDATVAAGATQVDVALSSCEWMSRAQARTIVEILDTAERPILIHCFHGSERTGLVAAFSELLRPDGDAERARGQFTLAHLYVPFGDGVVSARHIDRYFGWLAERGETHRPEVFRRWVREGYRPGEPTRENWPFDPYPLKVLTRRSGPTGAELEIVTEWTPGSEPGAPARTAGGGSPAPSTLR